MTLCTVLPSVLARCTSVLDQPFPVYRSLCIYSPNTVSTEREVESVLHVFSNGIMNVNFDFRHGKQLSLLRISVVSFNLSRHVQAYNMQRNTTSSQVNHSCYTSLSCNKMCIAIKLSLNIKRSDVLEAEKFRI